ncbi:acetyl-CoA carboxylase family protein [Planomonospora venezuelensis]|uniref:Acetyl/propionyl-CoA carboxylase alpha subunit/acetyl-CoA carboxylase carboxyltransferase component n=1 Tax=Planomonospora venezuelensis TaxID=1999 RepID=A0A841DFN6_PLAVE|nr:carboxyl transferase domain-containing protein [Planomonospora venezuelensis]MBB5967204.1 acetyl/propionyl-CoA carboxylase alpha subunit/acetyl-CoA carboxylase carboxyltransferase component [Planomonospora venezuelensis]GIN02973.1 carbamoyl phosphate synthase large subunit [Planomonospora venezuelensis]
MPPTPTLLIANRGEVAVRVARAAADLGWRSIAVHSPDDARSLHVLHADEARPLPGRGAAAYLDAEELLRVAAETGATHLHPGYGFLSESAVFARRCAEAGIVFVGPPAATLEVLGDKTAARALAGRAGVPVVAGTRGAVTLEQAEAFMASLDGGAVVLKALAGGGGRGVRVVRDRAELETAYTAARAEALAASGEGGLYAEALVEDARHIEVQILGDGHRVAHLWDRDCTVQRRHQKLLELAPAPALDPGLRARLLDAALRLAGAVRYAGLGTVEFLLRPDGEFFFIEANPRLQVEHTVTEELTGVDLVTAQLRLAQGATLHELGLQDGLDPALPPPPGCAVQLRVTMEELSPDGRASASGGTLRAFEPPGGPGLRVDTFAYTGFSPSPGFDPLLAKLVVSRPGGDLPALLRRAARALAEFRVDGVATNIALLRAVLERPELRSARVTTGWLEAHLPELITAGRALPQGRYFTDLCFTDRAPEASGTADVPRTTTPEGTLAVTAPTSGVVAALEVEPGAPVRAGRPLAVLEAMKMHFPVEAPVSGRVHELAVRIGDTVAAGHPLLFLQPLGGQEPAGGAAAADAQDLDHIRPALREVQERWALTRDPARPDAVARRRALGHRTARENVAALLDDGSLTEYGAFTVAAQRRRRSEEELLRRSPADGLITGVGTVNAELFGRETTCAVAAYDYTVLAGTQGFNNHRKLDRLIDLAARWKWPLVLLAEGGGGRPGDTDATWASALDTTSFVRFAALSGRVPLVGVVNGRCFAGNAALLGCCDVIIATRSTTLGMGGPAMIEGGGLGTYAPEEIGPVSVQAANGVCDLVVDDEEQAISAARRYLSYFQGDLADWSCADQRELRFLLPEDRKHVYDVRRVLTTLADAGSVLELRAAFAPGLVTALARFEGRPFGVLANDPAVLGGAITAQGADKAARFLNLCEAHRLPVLSLVDTPGFMVGPESEREAAVRHVSRMFLRAAKLTVPLFSVALRKGYGLGAQAMTGGAFHSPALNVSWPTGEFGGMGLEGAVRLAMRRELEAVADPGEREQAFRDMVALAYDQGRAVNVAAHLEIDAVIDPAETRAWLSRALRASPVPPGEDGGLFVDAW